MKACFRFAGFAAAIIIFFVFNVVIFSNLNEKRPEDQALKPKIVLISHVYSNPYWQYIKLGAEKAAKERNAIIEFEGPDTASVSEGLRFINMAYAAKVSGIITYVQDEDVYKPVIDKVVNGGVPLVTVDSDAEKSMRLAYVGTDNVSAGISGAKEMVRQIGTKGNVAVIMGGRYVKNQIERVKGFSEYLNKNSKINIVEVESSDSYLLEAELAARKIIGNNPEVKAIFCTSALDGQGAAKALISQKLVGKIKIICFDDLPETLDEINRGNITSTVVQRPFIMGYKAVNIIMDKLSGKKESGVFLTNVFVVNKGNLKDYKKELGIYKGAD